VKTQIFDRAKFLHKQVVEALTCPINRHGTRVEHECDDEWLGRHPDLLIKHYIENGGAAAFAKRRPEFVREVEIPDDLDCDL